MKKHLNKSEIGLSKVRNQISPSKNELDNLISSLSGYLNKNIMVGRLEFLGRTYTNDIIVESDLTSADIIIDVSKYSLIKISVPKYIHFEYMEPSYFNTHSFSSVEPLESDINPAPQSWEITSPKITFMGAEEGKTFFVEIINYGDSSIYWKNLNSFGGDNPGLSIVDEIVEEPAVTLMEIVRVGESYYLLSINRDNGTD